MVHSGRLLNCFMVLLILSSISLPAWADQGKDLFDKQCSGCHTIGGGDSGGPDLKGVAAKRSHEWLESVIIEPDKLTANKDPIQAELVKKYGYEMPNLGIGHEDALKIITYLSGADSTGATTAAPPAGEQMAAVVTPELVAQGKALFTGSTRMAKSGAPCLSCHPFAYPGIAGGNLSIADLNKSYQKMGDVGMIGALKSLTFPTMKKIYADRALTAPEIAALMALFKDSAVQTGGGARVSLPLMGGGLFVLLLLGLALYKRRIR
ncbi:MAG: c-type cytochrome [Desulfuromonadaceae bacterium]